MKNIRLIILGYILAIIFHGCDLGMSSEEESFEVSGGLGSSQWNPVYVKIVN